MNVFLITYFSFLALMIYAFVIADARKSRISCLFRETIPKSSLQIIEKLFGPRIASTVHNIGIYLLFERNPVFQLLYLFIGLGSWSIYIFHAFPMIFASNILSDIHCYTGGLTFILCMGSYYFACTKRAGYITPRTLPKFDNYDYDNVIFVNKICPTTNMRKLPRSKYCRTTKCHIPRFDHFCAWLNQAIGEENYRYFIVFICIQTFMCIYGSYVTAYLFWEQIQVQNLFNAQFRNTITGESVPATNAIIIAYLYHWNTGVFGCFVLQLVLSVCFLFFLLFHIMLICCNMTTNEFYKWRLVKKWHRQATIRYQRALKEGRVAVKNKNGYNLTPQSQMEMSKTSNTLDNMDVGCTGANINQSLLNQNNDSKISQQNSENKENTDDENDNNDDYTEWDDTIDPGPLPVNIYDLGVMNNITEVFYPRSLRKDALIRWAEFVTKTYPNKSVGTHKKQK